MNVCVFCNRFVICDETGLCLHEDTLDIFCDETYSNMAEAKQICGITETVDGNPIICTLNKNHFDEHAGALFGVQLLWE